MTSKTTYQSYLLRLWRDTPDVPWRASLQSTSTGERISFAEINNLFEFLVATMSTCPTNDAPSSDLGNRPSHSEAQNPNM